MHFAEICPWISGPCSNLHKKYRCIHTCKFLVATIFRLVRRNVSVWFWDCRSRDAWEDGKALVQSQTIVPSAKALLVVSENLHLDLFASSVQRAVRCVETVTSTFVLCCLRNGWFPIYEGILCNTRKELGFACRKVRPIGWREKCNSKAWDRRRKKHWQKSPRLIVWSSACELGGRFITGCRVFFWDYHIDPSTQTIERCMTM